MSDAHFARFWWCLMGRVMLDAGRALHISLTFRKGRCTFLVVVYGLGTLSTMLDGRVTFSGSNPCGTQKFGLTDLQSGFQNSVFNSYNQMLLAAKHNLKSG
jgi:hypothetical protein